MACGSRALPVRVREATGILAQSIKGEVTGCFVDVLLMLTVDVDADTEYLLTIT